MRVSYTRRILAKMYFPECEPTKAVRRLTNMIRRCTELYALLQENGSGFDKRQNLTIREVLLIKEFLGDPELEIDDVL